MARDTFLQAKGLSKAFRELLKAFPRPSKGLLKAVSKPFEGLLKAFNVLLRPLDIFIF